MAIDDLEGLAGAGQHKAIDDGGGAVEDEEEPEELVHALYKDVLPHEPVDEGLVAAVGLVQQQLRGWILCCQCCVAGDMQVNKYLPTFGNEGSSTEICNNPCGLTRSDKTHVHRAKERFQLLAARTRAAWPV